MSDSKHWEAVYEGKDPTRVSWFRPHLSESLRLIDGLALGPSARVVDVGGGASTLVDDLLDRGFAEISVIDLSATALARSRARLGERAEAVQWIQGDATTSLLALESVDIWHDRAVFHFLTESASRDAYVRELRRALSPGGYALIATFALDGPERCSGLPVARYAPDGIAHALGDDFELIEASHELHETPWETTQSFSYALCRRVGAA